MARITARNCAIGVTDSAGACQSISGRGNSVSMSITAEAPEVTAFQDLWRTRLPDGLRDWEMSVNGVWDGAAEQVDSILFGILGSCTLVHFGPGGSTSGCTKYSACAVCTNYTVDGAVEGAVTYSATFSGRSGSMTNTTWT